MKLSQVGTVYRKELLDTLRDRRTLISSILIPLLMFPVLIIGVGALSVVVITKARKQNPAVMILSAEHAPELARRIGKDREMEVVPAAADYVQQINDKKLRVAIEFPPRLEASIVSNPGMPQRVNIYFYDGEFRSENIARRLERLIETYNQETLKSRVTSRGMTEAQLTPFTLERNNVASAEKVTGNILGLILPYFIIILSLTGAMYPAIDLTAGEKERGTIETMLASPAGRTEIVAGKFLLVVTVSLVTTALSLVSFAITVLGGATLLARVSSRLTLAVSTQAMAAVFFLILPLAIFFAAALIAIASYARNYREAQTYVGPLMFLVIIPALFGMTPGIELTPKLALVPILNISLVAREIFAGVYPWKFIGLIFGSTAVLAAAAIWFAVRQFNREEVMFRS